MPDVAEISALMANRVRDNPDKIGNLIKKTLEDVTAPKFGGYGADFLLAPGSWLDPAEIRRKNSPEITKCRELVIRGEVHHQFSSHFVELMIGEKIPIFGGLPARIGERPQHRVAASFTTMMCNHELYLYHLMNGLESAPTFNRGIPMAQRYFVTANNAIPFMRYQAKVMAGLALWSIETERHGDRISYFVKPGPCLHGFMISYFKAVDWAMNVVTKALEDER